MTTNEEIEAWAKRQAAKAPPLTEQQTRRIAAILNAPQPDQERQE